MSKELVHSFNVKDAEKYDMQSAAILYNMRYWLRKNKANDDHKHDGRYWTYNSTKAFAELFPYLSESQVYRRLKKLEEDGILITGNYNKHNYDRTKWYSINEDEFKASRNDVDHSTQTQNEDYADEETIPDVNTDVNTDENARKKKFKRSTNYLFRDQSGKPASIGRSHDKMIDTGKQSDVLKKSIIKLYKENRQNVFCAQFLFNSFANSLGFDYKEKLSKLNAHQYKNMNELRGFDFYELLKTIKENGFIDYWIEQDWTDGHSLFFWLIDKEENYKRAITHKNNSRTKRPERQ